MFRSKNFLILHFYYPCQRTFNILRKFIVVRFMVLKYNAINLFLCYIRALHFMSQFSVSRCWVSQINNGKHYIFPYKMPVLFLKKLHKLIYERRKATYLKKVHEYKLSSVHYGKKNIFLTYLFLNRVIISHGKCY